LESKKREALDISFNFLEEKKANGFWFLHCIAALRRQHYYSLSPKERAYGVHHHSSFIVWRSGVLTKHDLHMGVFG
jgi:hypothetical protein